MTNTFLQDTADRLEQLKVQIDELKEMIEIAGEAGEEVSEQKATLKILETRRKKWLETLKSHGYKPQK